MDLDLLGSQPSLFRLYTQLALFFALPDPTLKPTIILTMSQGLERLAHTFPWVAGQVINVNGNSSSGEAPDYKIRPFKASPTLIIKEYSEDPTVPTLEELIDADFPMSMLGEDVFAPCPTVAAANDPAPVMLVQLSFIRGGVALCVNLQHNVCDMMGQAAVIGWLSKACRNESFAEEEINLGNTIRTNLIPLELRDGWDPLPELKYQLIPLKLAPIADPPPPPPCSWVYFDFNATSLRSLKNIATKSLPQSFGGYISMDDALSAFIFQSVLRARQSRLSADAVSTFARAVDARRYLHVHPSYPGILQNMTYTSYPLSSLLNLPLGHIAATMRQQVDPAVSDIAERTRALLTFLSQSPDNTLKCSFTATLDPGVDLMLSSWSKVAADGWHFGLGIEPLVKVRRPRFIPVESLMYIMPPNSSGAIAVAMCLRDEDKKLLIGDSTWIESCTLVG
ncbi:trichothecene 3-O-acetyltransferase [Pyrenochaeta sp. DS3sAY3a]|nr:trichothecene 3-O-acetyltransferase [Pyrenochaeta sp. DS3sAY3a]